MDWTQVGIGALIGMALLTGVLFYVIVQQRLAIDDGKVPSLPPERDPGPQPAVGAAAAVGHEIVHLHTGEPLSDQLRRHANLAELRGLRPYFEVGAIWCPPSKLVGEVLDDPQIVAVLAGIYLIRADMDEFGDDPKLAELRVTAVPVFFELDAEGRSTGRSMTGAAWGADTVPNISAALAKFWG